MPLSCPRYPNSWTVLLAVSGQRQAASGWDRGLELFQEEVSSWDVGGCQIQINLIPREGRGTPFG